MSSSIIAALSGGGSLLPGSMLGQIGNQGGGNTTPAIPTGTGGNALDQGYQGIGSRPVSGVVNPQGVQAADNIYGPWDARNAAVGAMPGAMGTSGIYRKSSNSPLNQGTTPKGYDPKKWQKAEQLDIDAAEKDDEGGDGARLRRRAGRVRNRAFNKSDKD